MLECVKSIVFLFISHKCQTDKSKTMLTSWTRKLRLIFFFQMCSHAYSPSYSEGNCGPWELPCCCSREKAPAFVELASRYRFGGRRPPDRHRTFGIRRLQSRAIVGFPRTVRIRPSHLRISAPPPCAASSPPLALALTI